MPFTQLTNSSPRPGSNDAREQIREALTGTFDARRHNAAGDDGGFEKAEIILRKIKNIGEAGDVRSRAEVHAGQAQQRLVNDAQIRFHRRAGTGVASVHAEVNRNVQDLGAFGIIHAEEENVAPAAMREVHAYGRAFAENRIGAVRAGMKQFAAEAQGMIGGMAHAEHPLIAAHGAHAAADLIGERLNRQPVIGHGQRAGNGIRRAVMLLHPEKGGDGLFKPAFQQMRVTMERNQGPRADARLEWQMKPVNHIKEKQRANAFVEIFTAPTERFESGAFREQFL